jgi:hypothetical protein
MWFSRQHYEVCHELKRWGLEPRFEPGDIVARGFADLGYEEFQVLPSAKLLSLTAGTVSPLPTDHAAHFFWVPSVDETIDLLEKRGAASVALNRVDQREWRVEVKCEGGIESHHEQSLHIALLVALRSLYRSSFKRSE